MGAVLVGLPGVRPEPVSAAEVFHRALRALSSGHTLTADVTLKVLDADRSAAEPRYDVDHYRLLLRADGSYRLTRRGPSETGWSPAGDSRPPLETAFDTRLGVLSTYSPTRGVTVRSAPRRSEELETAPHLGREHPLEAAGVDVGARDEYVFTCLEDSNVAIASATLWYPRSTSSKASGPYTALNSQA